MPRKIFLDYTDGKQSYSQLAETYQLSIKTIQSIIDGYEILLPVYEPEETVIIMDTFYFRRGSGVMVFRDAYQKRNLFRQYVKYETIALYQQGINRLLSQSWNIKGLVCDGRRGIFQAFSTYPIQMCHFHQQTIIRRYLTQNPRSEAARELKQLSLQLTTIDKESWCYTLQQWHDKWELVLKEKTHDPETKRWHYTHKRLRSAYRSLKTNTEYLFTYLKYPELHMPNTTNSLEGSFSNLESKIRNHPGLRMERKIKITDHFLTK